MSGSGTSSTPTDAPGCHQMGGKATREIPEALGKFPNSSAAWDRRVQSGQAGRGMLARFTQVGRDARWRCGVTGPIGSRTASCPPPHRSGRRARSATSSITMWDWADPKAYLHDEIASDKRNPTVNANGPIYGALEASADYMPVVDPVRHTATQIKLKVRDPKTPSEADTAGGQGIALLGLTRRSGRASRTRTASPWTSRRACGLRRAFARTRRSRSAGRARDHPSAKAYPLNQSGRQMQMYDPKTKEVTTIDTCFGTHHLNFDDKDVLWFTGGGAVEGWFDTKIYDKTKDETKAQGWTVFVVDTNGNGKRDAYVEPDQPLDPAKDKRVNAPFYGVAPSPVDGSIWGSVLGMPGMLVRLTLGSNPPSTALTEIYEVPWKNSKASAQGYAPRGMDVDSNGVVWTVLSSGHLASFDRRKCKGPLNGPNAMGKHCPEGWSLYPLPGPNYKGATESGSADTAYYNFVDRFDMLGMGKNVSLATGNGSEALLALIDGKFLTFRVPYPMGFYAKGLDGRIDDAKAAGRERASGRPTRRAPRSTSEGGKGTTSKLVKFQVRNSPLDK